MKHTSWLLAVLVCTGMVEARAETDFYRDLYPILRANCLSCHNKTTTKGGLNMETPALVRKGGETGEGAVPGRSGESLVVQAARHTEDLVMPPKNNKAGAADLSTREMAVLCAWIDEGAKDSVRQAQVVQWQPLPAGVNPILCAALTRDGRWCAVGRGEGIAIYDLAALQSVAELGAAHRGMVQSIAFSPDGRHIASGGYREVKVWKRTDEGGEPRLLAPGDEALAAEVAQEAAAMVWVGRDGALHSRDLGTGAAGLVIPAALTPRKALLSLSPDGTLAAAWSPDSGDAASASGTFSVWRLRDAQCVGQADAAALKLLTWTKDGKGLLTAGADRKVSLWPVPNCSCENWEPQASWSADGEVKALCGTSTAALICLDGGVARLCKLPEGEKVREWTLPGLAAATITADGRRVAFGTEKGGVQSWELTGAKPLDELAGDLTVLAQKAALDRAEGLETLNAATQTLEIARLEAENKALDELLKKATEAIGAAEKALPEKQKAQGAATAAREAAEKELAAVDAADAAKHKAAEAKLDAAGMAERTAVAGTMAMEDHRKDAQAEQERIRAAREQNLLSIEKAKKALAEATEQAKKAVEARAALEKQASGSGARIVALSLSADGQTLAAVGSDGRVRAWQAGAAQPLVQAGFGRAVTAASVVLTTDHQLAACTPDGTTLRLSTRPHWELERTLGGEGSDNPFVDRVTALRFSPDGQSLAVGGGEPSRSGDISVWEVASGRLRQRWDERHKDAVLCLDFSPDGKLLASGAADRLGRLTEVATGKNVRLLEGHTHHVLGISFRADGRSIVTAGGDGTLLVWDTASGERKKKIEGWTREVTSAQYLGATKQIVTSGGDRLVRVVNDDGPEVRAIGGLPDFVQVAAGSPSARLLVSGGDDGVLRVWESTSGQELAKFGPAAP